jgi:lipoprotein NlpI
MAKRSTSKRRTAPADPWRLLKAGLISLAVLWIFWPALHGNWLWDDDLLVSQNAVVQDPNGLSTIWFQPDALIDYFPLKVTVEWIEWRLFGNDTLGYHAVSLVLHLLSALLVWRLLARFGLRWAWLGGLIFAIHPVVVESVAWIAELKNTLSLPPFLLAMLFWIDYDQHLRARDYRRALVLFLAAMLCKPTMVMFPVVILLYTWWKHGRIGWSRLKASAPFFAVSLVLGLVTALFVHNHSIPQEMPPLGGFLPRLACAGLSIAFYLSKCVLPIGLMPIYPRWSVDPPVLAQFLPWPVLVAALFGLWTQRHTWGRHALLGLGFFLLLLLPFAGFVAGAYMRFSWVMDHIVYIPLVGLVGLAVAGLESLARRLPAYPRFGLIGCVAAALLLAAVESHRYAGKFVDRETYWAYAAERNPNAWPAHNNLATALQAKGDHAGAMEQFNQAVAGNPDYFEAPLNRGQLKLLEDDPKGAQADLDRANALEPQAPLPYFTRAVLDQIKGDASAALSDLRRYRQLAPSNANADYAALWLWSIRAQQGEKTEADRELSTTNWNASPTAWPSQNRRFLLGQLSETDYLAAAISTDKDLDASQHCEAWYYIGLKRLVAGDKPSAKDAFRASQATGKTDYFEYTLSRAQLR